MIGVFFLINANPVYEKYLEHLKSMPHLPHPTEGVQYPDEIVITDTTSGSASVSASPTSFDLNRWLKNPEN